MVLTELEKVSNGEVVTTDWYELHRTGIDIIREPTWDEWYSKVTEFIMVGKSVFWWIGDLLHYGEYKWGDKYLQALDETDYTHGTLRNMNWVAGAVDKSRRQDTVDPWKHMEVASLEPEQQEILLREAAEKGLTKIEIRHRKKEIIAGKPLPVPVHYNHLVNRSKVYTRAKLMVYCYFQCDEWMRRGIQGPQRARRMRQMQKFKNWLWRWSLGKKTADIS
jgi:hypothetical protein